ncbi:MAG: hypothetical protein HKP12_00815 [Gammaproteobacteria bacterium]|nr:hypothetical protein [Gammaproteobacteria bacterium]NNJ95685.1 hypothetical protein [Gammaproteobacteria bacterium]
MSDANEKISKLYRETSIQEPSQQLDVAILQASREASEKPTRSGPFSATWPAAASFAAIIVIATILVPMLKHEAPQQQTAQDPAEKSIPYEPADEEAFNSYSASDNAGRALIAPSAFTEDSLTLERNILVEEPATAEPGIASSDDTQARALRKLSSSSAELEQKVPESPAEKTTSRMRAADSAPFAVLTPEMWEVRIERLIEQGEYEKARVEISQLKQHFPDFKIRQSLLDKLRP